MRPKDVQLVFSVMLFLITDAQSHIEEIGNKIVFHQEQQTLGEAESMCGSHGGTHLVIRDFVVQEILADIPSLRNVSVWVGLSYSNKSWSWADGFPLSPQLVASVGTTGCVSVTLDLDGVFMEPRSCEAKLPYFCQYKTGTCFFRVYHQSSIVGHNIFQLTVTTLETCKDICGHMTEFVCASFEYSEVNKFCQMNDVNRWTASESFVFKIDKSWDYYHKSCYTTTLLTEDSDQYTSTTSNIQFSTEIPLTITPAYVQITTESFPSVLIPKRFVLSNVSLSWEEAKQYCKQEGGSIAKIDDPSIVPETGYQSINEQNEIFWIGLRKAGNAKWGWFDNSTLEWSNFKYKPNKLDFIKACGVVSLYSGWWYTAVCNEKKRFVCQFPYESCNFVPLQNATLIAHNIAIFSNVSIGECENYCTATDFTCRSFEYNHVSYTCQISDQNRWTVPKYFYPTSANWTYSHRRCNFGYDSVTEATTQFQTTSEYKETSVDLTTTEVFTTENHNTRSEKLLQEVVEELEELGKELKRKRVERSKTSAVDNRPSAKGVGIAAAIILISIFGSIVILDLSTIGAQCKQFSTKGKHKGSKYKSKNLLLQSTQNNSGWDVKENRHANVSSTRNSDKNSLSVLPSNCNVCFENRNTSTEIINNGFSNVLGSEGNKQTENSTKKVETDTTSIQFSLDISEDLKQIDAESMCYENTNLTVENNDNSFEKSQVRDNIPSNRLTDATKIQVSVDVSREWTQTDNFIVSGCNWEKNTGDNRNELPRNKEDNTNQETGRAEISPVEMINDTNCDNDYESNANEDQNRHDNQKNVDITYL